MTVSVEYGKIFFVETENTTLTLEFISSVTFVKLLSLLCVKTAEISLEIYDGCS